MDIVGHWFEFEGPLTMILLNFAPFKKEVEKTLYNQIFLDIVQTSPTNCQNF